MYDASAWPSTDVVEVNTPWFLLQPPHSQSYHVSPTHQLWEFWVVKTEHYVQFFLLLLLRFSDESLQQCNFFHQCHVHKSNISMLIFYL